MLRKKPAGMWIHGSRSLPPASSNSTLVLPSAVRRLASTQPAEPAPTTMKSNSWAAVTAFPSLRFSGDSGGVEPLQQISRPCAFDLALIALDDSQDCVSRFRVAPRRHLERHGIAPLVVAAIERHDVELQLVPVILPVAAVPSGIDV